MEGRVMGSDTPESPKPSIQGSAADSVHGIPADSGNAGSLSVREWGVASLRKLALYSFVFLWLWFWRSNSFTGGDSEQWVRMIDGGAWFQETQPLVFFLVQSVFQAIHATFGGTAQMAFALTSCLAGVAAFDILGRIYEGTDSRRIRLSLVLTAGFTTLFYGHLESYAMPAATLMFHFLCIKRSTEERWPVLAIPLSYMLMVALHLVALFVFPAVVFVAVSEARRRSLNGKQFVNLGLAFGGTLLVWMMIRSIGTGRSDDSLGHLLWVGRTLMTEPAALAETLQPRLKLLFAFWNAGALPLLLVQAWALRGERLVRYWSPYLILLLGFSVVWVAFRGEADFDLHSFPWIVAAILAAWAYRPVRWSRFAVILVLSVNLFLWVNRTATFADLPNRGTATLNVCPEVFGEDAYLLLDERLRLRKENRFVQKGAHSIRYFSGAKVVVGEIELKKGKTYRLCITEGNEIELARLSEPEIVDP